MGPGQDQPPFDRDAATAAALHRGQSYMAVDHDDDPPEWFRGVVERRHRGVREHWAYGRKVPAQALAAGYRS